jgi:transposase
MKLLDRGAKGTSEMNRGVFVGLDIDHGTLQAAVRPAGQKWFANTSDSGICEIANVLASVQPEIIVLEAQGGVELPVAGTLATTGLPLAFVSQRNVRDFAKAIGQARRERNHAELLAHFAELVQPEVRPIPANVVEQLQALKARQREMMSMLELERGRLNTHVISVQRSVRNHVNFLERALACLAEEINQTVRASSFWR